MSGALHNSVAEFISPQKCALLVLKWVVLSQKVYTFSFKVGSIIPKSVKCIHSATKVNMKTLEGQPPLNPNPRRLIWEFPKIGDPNIVL